MNKKSHILEQYQQLDEVLLTSEFTFGFELEAILGYDTDMYYSCDADSHGESRETYNNINDYIDGLLLKGVNSKMAKTLMGQSHTHADASLIADDDNGSDIPFEYSSPIIPCTPNWFGNVIKTLEYLKEEGVYTNKSCGFHTHIRFGNMNERDVIWIYCNLANDYNFLQTIYELNGNKLFSNEYANYDSIIALGDAISDKNYLRILKYLNTEKYRAIRIHPQGTLEWRGPRGCLEHDLKYIRNFFKLLYSFIKKVREYMDSDTLTGTNITKKEFFENLKKEKPESNNNTEFISGSKDINLKSADRKNRLRKETISKLSSLVKENPKILFNLAKYYPKKFHILFSKLNLDSQIDLINNILNSDYFVSMNIEDKKNFINNSLGLSYMEPQDIQLFGLSKYVDENGIKRLLSKDDLNLKQIYYIILIMKENGMLKSLRQIEEMIYKVMDMGGFSIMGYFSAFIDKNYMEPPMVSIIGERNLAKLSLFVVNACRVLGLYDQYLVSDYDDEIMYIKDIVKKYNLEEQWDKIIISLCDRNTFFYKLLINPLKIEQLLYMVNSDRSFYDRLSAEDKKRIRAYL